MLYKFTTVLLMFASLLASAVKAEELTIWDTSGGGMGLQAFFGRVFNKESAELPQDLTVDILCKDWQEIKDIPAGTIVADDGLTAPAAAKKFTKYPYASLPVVLAVHKNNPLDDLSLAEIKRIFSGRVGNWSRLGGVPGVIKLAGFAASSSIGRVFGKLAMGQNLQKNAENDITSAISPELIVCNSSAAGAVLVQTAENMIVFGGNALLEKVDGKYKILKVNGILPSRENILSGKYPLQTAHAIYCSKNAPSPAINSVLKFLKNAAADSPELLTPGQ